MPVAVGPVPRGRRSGGGPFSGRSATGRRLYVQVPQRWAGRTGFQLCGHRIAGDLAAADLGMVCPDRAVRDGTNVQRPPGHTPCAAWDAIDPRPRCRGRRNRVDGRGGHRGDRRESSGTHRIWDRPVRPAQATDVEPTRPSASRRPPGCQPSGCQTRGHGALRPWCHHRLP